jgi:cytochrome c556
LALGAVLCFAAAAAAWAGSLSEADYVAARQAKYKDLGAAFKTVMDQLRQSPADLGAIRQSAKAIATMSADQYGLFRPGSGPESGAKTKAKPTIWTDPAAFKAAQDQFHTRAAEFLAAVAGTDQAAITVSARQLGGACAACHTQFRAQQ